MKRKTPIRHRVRIHTREGKVVNSFLRGSGTNPSREHKVVSSSGGPIAKLKFDENIKSVIKKLEQTTGKRFAQSSMGMESRMIVPFNRRGRSFRFGEPLTENQLLNLSDEAYETYEFLKNIEQKMSPIKKNYYVIETGGDVFGGGLPNRGRERSLNQILLTARRLSLSHLWNYYEGRHLEGRWKPIKILYYESESGRPKVVADLKTNEDAEKEFPEYKDYIEHQKVEIEKERKMLKKEMKKK